MDSPEIFPIVLCCSGNDPSGGAGIQADIEALSSQACHAAPIITCLTVQDSQDVKRIEPLHPSLFTQQMRTVLEDMPVAVIKVGLLGSVEIVKALYSVLMDYPELPMVLDPILASGGSGKAMANDDLIEAMERYLIPNTFVLTPNRHEALTLSGAENEQSAALNLLENGAEYVLITGADSKTEQVHNVLYHHATQLERFDWPRLPHSYHGSGCTLSASIAGLLAQGEHPIAAVRQAQEYTWQSLKAAHRPGMGQHLPNRFYWASSESEKK
ncbi:MAG: hydroxymethylpyrimidine/phosphomethylpyrimidine kinase [Gammaproteobacteria bacterium]|nr:hydroxymethylpyrimidine/phosphomethylpyrimidine kinase [Gammaproteobacteria bacterium]